MVIREMSVVDVCVDDSCIHSSKAINNVKQGDEAEITIKGEYLFFY